MTLVEAMAAGIKGQFDNPSQWKDDMTEDEVKDFIARGLATAALVAFRDWIDAALTEQDQP